MQGSGPSGACMAVPREGGKKEKVNQCLSNDSLTSIIKSSKTSHERFGSQKTKILFPSRLQSISLSSVLTPSCSCFFFLTSTRIPAKAPFLPTKPINPIYLPPPLTRPSSHPLPFPLLLFFPQQRPRLPLQLPPQPNLLPRMNLQIKIKRRLARNPCLRGRTIEVANPWNRRRNSPRQSLR